MAHRPLNRFSELGRWLGMLVIVIAVLCSGCRRTIPPTEKTAQEYLGLALGLEAAPDREQALVLYNLLDVDTRARLAASARILGTSLGQPVAIKPEDLLISRGPQSGAEIGPVRVVQGGDATTEGARCRLEVQYGTAKAPLELVYQDGEWRVLVEP